MAIVDGMNWYVIANHCVRRFNPEWWQVVRLGIAVLILLCSIAAAAQQVQITLDPAQTKVDWTLGDVLHTVHGTFKLKSGNIVFDSKTGDASGQIVVEALSGESGNRTRDGKMQKEILESGRYPEIVFLPKHMTGNLPAQGGLTLQIQGIFRIHGGDHDLKLSLPVQADGSRAKATTTFEVPYEAWGMKNPSTFLLKVENKVAISISTVGTVATGATAAPAASRQ